MVNCPFPKVRRSSLPSVPIVLLVNRTSSTSTNPTSLEIVKPVVAAVLEDVWVIFARSSDSFTSFVTVIIPDTFKSAFASVSRSSSSAIPMVFWSGATSLKRTPSTSTYEFVLEIVSPAVALEAAV